MILQNLFCIEIENKLGKVDIEGVVDKYLQHSGSLDVFLFGHAKRVAEEINST